MERVFFTLLVAVAAAGCNRSGVSGGDDKAGSKTDPAHSPGPDPKPKESTPPKAGGKAPKQGTPATGKVTPRTASDEKLRAALKLCGNGYYELSITYTFKEFDTETVNKLAKEVLFDKGTGELAERFPQAIEKVAERVPKGRFQIRINKEVALKDIRHVLGQADTTAKDILEEQAPFGGIPNRIPIVWHQYGWCCFGANERGVVMALKAECVGLKAADKKRPEKPKEGPAAQAPEELIGTWEYTKRDDKDDDAYARNPFMEFTKEGKLVVVVRDTTNNKPAYISGKYKVVDTSRMSVTIEGSTSKNCTLPRWSDLAMAEALLAGQPYTTTVDFTVTGKQLTVAGVKYARAKAPEVKQSNKAEDKSGQEEKHRSALKLFAPGELRVGGIRAKGSATEDLAQLDKVLADRIRTERELQTKGMGAIAEIAREWDKKWKAEHIEVVLVVAVETAKVQKIMGKEESTRTDEYELEGRSQTNPFPRREKITWYKYAWIEFGVIDGAIRVVRVICNKVPTSLHGGEKAKK